MVAVNMTVQASTFAGLYILMRNTLRIPVAWKSVGTYVLGSLATAAVLLILPDTTTLTATFGKLLAGVAVYGGLLYAIDADARKLVADVWAEIRGISKNHFGQTL
jgi:hypothetical protein